MLKKKQAANSWRYRKYC